MRRFNGLKKWGALLLLALFLRGGEGLRAGEVSAVPEAFYLEGLQLLKTDPEQAFKKLTEALKEGNPAWNHLSDCFFQRGLLLFNQERIPDAAQDFSMSTEADAKNFDAFLFLGKCYFMLGKSQECLQVIQVAEGLNPKNSEVHYVWARMLMTQVQVSGKMLEANMITAAIEQFDKAIELNKKYTEAYFYRGLAHASINNSKKALKDLQQAVKTNPKLYRGWYEMARVSLSVNLSDKALESLEKCLEIREFKPAYQLILSVCQELKEDDKLEHYLEKALIAYPADPDFKKMREIYKERPKKEEAGAERPAISGKQSEKNTKPIGADPVSRPQSNGTPKPAKGVDAGPIKKATLEFPEDNWY